MAEAPKIPLIIRERLHVQAGAPVNAEHPDADVLTAFAENTLAAPERSLVLNHLAVCSSCREIVIFSQPSAVQTADVARLAAPQGRNWMTFRWAALAACLVLTVGVVLLERSARLSPAEHLAPPPPPSAATSPVNDNLQAKMETESAAANLPATKEQSADASRAREKRDRTQSTRGDIAAFGYADMKANSVGRPYDGNKDYNGARGTLGRLEQQPATREEDSDRSSFSAPGLISGGTAETNRSA